MVTAFHALQDTATPVKVAALCLLINASLNFLLMEPLKVGGIALASSIAGTIDFLILFYIMDKKLKGLNSELFLYFIKVALASVLTGVVVYFLWLKLPIVYPTVKLSIVGFIGFVVYVFICLKINVIQAHKILKYLKKWLSSS